MRRSNQLGHRNVKFFCFAMILVTASAFTSISTSFAQQRENIVPDHPLVVGYFPGWAHHTRFFVKDLLAEGAMPLLDQINYAKGNIVGNECAVGNPDGDLVYTFSAEDSIDGTADTPQTPLRGNFHQLQELKRLYPHVKILISIEGRSESFVAAAQAANRHAFVASCIQRFIKGKFAEGIEVPGIFDGVDVDWEYPEEVDKVNFIALLGEFRRQLNSVDANLLLTVAMGDNRATYQHLDMPAVAMYVNQVGVMNYDYSGPWSKRTGLIAPLFSSPGDPEKSGDVDSTIRGYLAAGVPASKLLLGLPFYAYSWEKVSQENHGLFQMGEPAHNDLPYSHIVAIQNDFTTYRDPKSLAPWLFDGTTFWTYDDETSIAAKLKYARQQALGGVMIWELSGDTNDGKLLKVISERFANRDEDENNEDHSDDAARETP